MPRQTLRPAGDAQPWARTILCLVGLNLVGLVVASGIAAQASRDILVELRRIKGLVPGDQIEERWESGPVVVYVRTVRGLNLSGGEQTDEQLVEDHRELVELMDKRRPTR